MAAPTIIDLPIFPSRLTPGSTWEDTISTWWLNTKTALESYTTYFQYVKTAAITWSTDVNVTYASANSFEVTGSVVGEYAVGTRVELNCGADGWRGGIVASSSYSSGTNKTTVVLVMDPGGAVLTSNLSYCHHGNDCTYSLAGHASNHAIGARDELSLIPTGAIFWWPLNTTPNGTIKANGATVSRTAYSRLFSIYGTTYGAGDGSTTFGTPDIRGLFIRAVDDGRGYDSGRSYGSVQATAYPAHTHTTDPGLANTSTDGSHTHSATTVLAYNGGGGSPVFTSGGWGNQNLAADGAHYHNVDIASTTSSSAGSGSESRPPNIALYPLIKY